MRLDRESLVEVLGLSLADAETRTGEALAQAQSRTLAEVETRAAQLLADLRRHLDEALAVRDVAAAETIARQLDDLREGLGHVQAERLAETETRSQAALADLEARMDEALASVDGAAAEAIQLRFAEILERVASEIAALPAPEPGEPGTDGRDGLDRVLALPRMIRSGEGCAANEIAWHENGLWQSVRVTSGNPADDPSGWKCLVPGISDFQVGADWEARQVIFAARMSDGQLYECRGRMAAGPLPPDFIDRGWGVLAGDTWRPEGSDVELMAKRDGALLGNVEDWQETRLRGFRGQKGPKGDKGDKGAPGAGLVALDVVRGDAGLVILPRFADPAIEADPIPVQLLIADPEPGRQLISTFAGEWHAGRTYGRGEVVRADVDGQARLCLSIRSENNAPAHDGRAWQVML